MTPARDRSNEVGDFLKARRAELSPRDVGLPDAVAHRKVAGLRREKVAQLAAISVDYYTRLEQGRVQPSAAVLATIARALRLDHDQQTYLYQLAGKTDARPRRRPQQPRPAMRHLLDQLTEIPALVLGRRMDILAWNRQAAALYTDFAQVPPGSGTTSASCSPTPPYAPSTSSRNTMPESPSAALRPRPHRHLPPNQVTHPHHPTQQQAPLTWTNALPGLRRVRWVHPQ